MTAPRSLGDRVRGVRPVDVVEVFVVANLAFLGVDITIAHAANAFARPEEWIPIGFSVLGPLLLFPGAVSLRAREATNPVAIAVAAASIVVGLAGAFLHLESSFFQRVTLRDLVYTAPFVAPLSYVGLGLLLLLNRMERSDRPLWGAWVVFLAFAGFVGNFALALLDHAQNGFFRPLEWIAVGAAAFGATFLGVAIVSPTPSYLRVCLWVMALQAAVGALGAWLHVRADLARHGASLSDRVVYGAPIFAPLLFADLAVLGAIGVWSLLRTVPVTSTGRPGGDLRSPRRSSSPDRPSPARS